MRLKSISLAGFKSFVDPTRVTLPSNMCAVVGPNGCGKSNIIDAVRWVMGESSAKTLRGESMTDVIFNGTTHRQPVGQASIELLFDNSTGKVGGEYAAYTEISVRRVVSREGTSDYFLNGNKWEPGVYHMHPLSKVALSIANHTLRALSSGKSIQYAAS